MFISNSIDFFKKISLLDEKYALSKIDILPAYVISHKKCNKWYKANESLSILDTTLLHHEINYCARSNA